MNEIKIIGMEVVRMKRENKFEDRKAKMIYEAHVSRCWRY
jgi:hypothetical protein